jgi:ribosomal protein S18 acetylase RimI-like enzyme
MGKINYLPGGKQNIGGIAGIDIMSNDYPLDEEIIVDCINLNQMYVAMEGKKVVGYVCWQEIEGGVLILGLAVHTAYRRQGIGKQLIEFIKDLPDIGKVELEVRERNVNGQLFLRAVGFNCFSVLKQMYDESDEDCYVFTTYIEAKV